MTNLQKDARAIANLLTAQPQLIKEAFLILETDCNFPFALADRESHTAVEKIIADYEAEVTSISEERDYYANRRQEACNAMNDMEKDFLREITDLNKQIQQLKQITRDLSDENRKLKQ
jgi:hypothetical protein